MRGRAGWSWRSIKRGFALWCYTARTAAPTRTGFPGCTARLKCKGWRLSGPACPRRKGSPSPPGWMPLIAQSAFSHRCRQSSSAIAWVPPSPCAWSSAPHILSRACSWRPASSAHSGLPDYDPINASFFATPFDWAGIRARKGRAGGCWAGDDDPYVPLARSREMADRLGVELEVVLGGGHLNAETGFTAFPQLRDAVLELQKT